MERLRLHDGRDITCLTTENTKEKRYYCNTHKEACSVSMTLTDIGKSCHVNFGKHGWMVVIQKGKDSHKKIRL